MAQKGPTLYLSNKFEMLAELVEQARLDQQAVEPKHTVSQTQVQQERQSASIKSL